MAKHAGSKGLGLLAAFAVVLSVAPAGFRAQQPAPPLPTGHVDPQARQILDRTIQALGGPAFLSAKTLTCKGRMFFFQEGNNAGMEPFESWNQFPDKRRLAIAKNKKNLSMLTGDLTYEGETKPIILINSGDKGWELDQYGLVEQPDTQRLGWALSNRFSLENLLRVRINEPRVLIQVGKVDFVDNVPTQGIDIMEPGDVTVRLDLHLQTHLPTRISYRVRNVKEDAWDEYSDAYSDYKTFDGVQIPMHVTRYLNGDRIGETFRNFAKLNDDYPASYFVVQQ